MTDEAVLRSSREAIEHGSKSFAAASRLLPGPARDGAHLLYAWCRHCDDRIDGQRLGHAHGEPGPPSAEVLAELEAQTRRALAGEGVGEAPFQALREVVTQHRIPHAYPLAHLEGFAMDVRGERYRSLEDTVRYSYHVAGVVGVMMAHVMGVRDRATLDRAADLGIALQLTNIARDVMDDAAVGRIYLPERWLAKHGVEPQAIADGEHRWAVAAVVARLLDVAERYYRSADAGIGRLPWQSAWAIATAKYVYRDIGRIVRARGPHAWDRRVRVPGGRKMLWMAAAALDASELVSRRERDLPRRASDLWPIPSVAE